MSAKGLPGKTKNTNAALLTESLLEMHLDPTQVGCLLPVIHPPLICSTTSPHPGRNIDTCGISVHSSWITAGVKYQHHQALHMEHLHHSF